MQREHTLQSGEIIVIDSEGKHPGKPWFVMCIAADGEEVRWCKDFATQAEAEAEYTRFDV